MKPFTLIGMCLFTSLGLYGGILRAQSCLNCWINPNTGQMESLERIIPRQTSPSPPSPPKVASPPPSPTVSSPPTPEPEKPGETKPKTPKVPILDDPIGIETPEPQPLPQTQVDPRLRQREAVKKTTGQEIPNP